MTQYVNQETTFTVPLNNRNFDPVVKTESMNPIDYPENIVFTKPYVFDPDGARVCYKD